MRKGMLILGAILSMTPMLSQSSSYSLPDDRVSLLGQLEKGGARLVSRKSDGKLIFIGTNQGKGLPLPASVAQSGVSAPSSDIHINTWAPLLGVKKPSKQLSLTRERHLKDGRKVIRYRQMVSGLPVVGGDLVMNLSKDDKLLSLGGKLSDVESIDTAVSVSANSAASVAVKAVSKWYGMAENELEATTPELSVLDAKLLRPDSQPERLVWRLEVMPKSIAPIKEFLLVDAKSGVITLHFNQVHELKNRITYSSQGTDLTQYLEVCNESHGDACSGGSDEDADAAHIHAGDSYDFFFNHHGRDSLDDAGMAIISNVDWDDGASCPNAFWWNDQMYYCDTLSLSDDIVGHELTHGVTENTSNLYYYYQSGAINEALSDIWGEFIDLENGRGSDGASDRWLMGEDASAFGGAIRSMSNPPLYGDPDKMTSSNYFTDSGDNGGVHYNSGLANKATYLMVDGGTFNGYIINPIGVDKAAAIFYEVQTNLLTSGSDYGFLHEALYQSCQNLIGGAEGISFGDCGEVRKATLAVEMNQQPAVDFNPDANTCPNDYPIKDTLFSDDFESGFTQWTITSAINGSLYWALGSGYATSGTISAGTFGGDTLSDESLELKNNLSLPAGESIHLVFNHVFDLESGLNNYDAGLIEYSLDNGSTWVDGGSLVESGQSYNGVIFSGSGNPAAGTSAFTSTSHGYVSSRLNLSAFAGSSIRFRFRAVTDTSVASPLGWIVDDVKVVTCSTTITNSAPVANAGSDGSVRMLQPYTFDAQASYDPDVGDSISYLWEQISGTSVTLLDPTSAQASFSAPGVPGDLLFQVTVTDGGGASSSDTVTVMVLPNTSPVANAGNDDTVVAEAIYSLSGAMSYDPDDGDSIASYLWEQTGGVTVILSNASVASPSFTAPSNVGEALTFRLTVTDTFGASDSDTVSITTVAASSNSPPLANAGSDANVTVGASYTLNGSLSSDPDAGDAIASYLWEQIGGQAVTLSSNSVARPSFTAPETEGEVLIFRLTVTDTFGASDSDTVSITTVAASGGGGGGGGSLNWWVLVSLLGLWSVKRRSH